MAKELDGVIEKDHFGSDSFSANKRMFATVWHDHNSVNLRLSPKEQKEFLSMDGEGFLEIDNAWGRQGWTKVQLEFVDVDEFKSALLAAWKYSAVAVSRAGTKKPAKNKKPLGRRSTR